MSQTQMPSTLERMIEPLSRCFNVDSARKLVALQIDPELEGRLQYLAAQANEGLLTPEEREEYQTFINVDDLISILKLKACRYLQTNDFT